MTGPAPYRSLTLGLYPTARGFAWIAFSGPFAPHDWGFCRLDKGESHRKNERCLRRVEKLLARLQPEIIVLESFVTRSAIRSPRIQKLSKAIASLAADGGVEVAIYTRLDVQSAFRAVGAKTRFEIASAIARQVPALNTHLPSKRKRWESEDKRMAVFNAAALALTQYAFGASQLFEDLKEAA